MADLAAVYVVWWSRTLLAVCTDPDRADQLRREYARDAPGVTPDNVTVHVVALDTPLWKP